MQKSQIITIVKDPHPMKKKVENLYSWKSFYFKHSNLTEETKKVTLLNLDLEIGRIKNKRH